MCMFYSDAFTGVLFVTAQIKTQGLNFSYSMIKKNCRREGVEMNQHVWWVAGKMESLPPPSKGLFSSQTLVLKYYGHCLLFFFILLNTQCCKFFNEALFFVSFISLWYMGTYLDLVHAMPRCCLKLYHSFPWQPELMIGVYTWQTSPQTERPWAIYHFSLECENKILSTFESFLNDLNG